MKIKSSTSNLTVDQKLNPASIAAITEGYLPADLKDFVDRAVHQSAIRTMSNSPGVRFTRPLLSMLDADRSTFIRTVGSSVDSG